MLDVMPPDDCCSAPFSAACLAGLIEAVDSWSCPDCGCEWRCTVRDAVRLWEPVLLCEVLTLR